MWPFDALGKKDNKPRDKPKATVRPSSWWNAHKIRGDNSIGGNEAIYAAVSRIANTVACMPMHLYQGSILQADHPLERLVARSPNDNFTPFGFVQTMEACRNVEGNAYALIIEEKLGVVKRLDILDPTRVQPVRHPETGEMWYYIAFDDGRRLPLPGCQLIVLRHLSANGEVGIKPIDVLRGSLDYDRQVKEYGLQQLDNINQGIFLTVPGTGLGEEEKENVIQQFMEAYEQSGGRVVVLEGGLTATTFSQTAVSANVLDVERIVRTRVAAVYNIPPHMMGDYSEVTYATAEQLMQEFLQMTIMPIVTQWEQELNKKLLTEADYRAGYRFHFDISALTRADTATTAERFHKAIRGSWLTPNEARELEGRPPVENGDELMASRDLLPLRISMTHPELLLGGKSDKGTANQPALHRDQEGGSTS